MPSFRIINGTIETLRTAGINRSARGRFGKGTRGRVPVPAVQDVGSLPTEGDFERSELRYGFWLTRSNQAELASAAATRAWNARTSTVRWEDASQEVRTNGRWNSGPIACGTPTENLGRGACPGTNTARLCNCAVSPNPWVDAEGKVRPRMARAYRSVEPSACPEHGVRYPDCSCGGIDAGAGFTSCAGHKVSLTARGTRDLFRAFPVESAQPLEREPWVKDDPRKWLSTPGR